MPALPAGSATPFDPLLDVMRSRFDVAIDDVCAGGHCFRIASVRNPETLLDTITDADFSRDERLPYWAELWTSAIVLAEKILAGGSLEGKHVLELGCGLGLAGIAAATAGASVTMTDYDDDALMFARWNVAANLAAPALDRVSIRSFDWRQPPDDCFDLVLGADIVYERRHVTPLLSLFHSALKSGGVAMLGEPDRRVGDEFLLAARLSGAGVAVETVPTQRRGRESTVRLITVRPEIHP